MLSVAKLAPGQEAYYERSVAGGLDDYYAGEGESPGIWAGSGAAALGLSGLVEDGQLGKLVSGIDPASGQRLRSHPKSRTITVDRIDPQTGHRRQQLKELKPVAGYDLVFSVPKSVSLLHALGDETTRIEIVQAHTVAWQAALAYLEREACVTRRGKGGLEREHARGFVGAAYQHRTSRAQDPHLHTHLIVANMAQSTDGSWRALEGDAILRTYRLAAGYLYQAQLRVELVRRLGVEWRAPAQGMAELDGVPEPVLAEFSTRRRQVVEHLRATGASGWHAAQVAAVATRERKRPLDLTSLREDWRARAAEHGLGRKELIHLLQRPRVSALDQVDLRATARQLLGVTGLTEKKSTFTDPELVMAWAHAHEQGASAEQVLELAARLSAAAGVRRLGEPPAPGRASRYSTDELLKLEDRALALVLRGRDARAPAVTAIILERVLARPDNRVSLSPEQEQMVRALATSRDRVTCVVGLAGAGKTTAAQALAQAFDLAAVPVIGAAPTGRAAEQLADETGLPSFTLHRLLIDARREGGFPRGLVLLVDEAGMAETRVLTPILELVERAEGKAILIGDPRQLPSVGAGGLFAAIVERAGAVELRENRRQHDRLERVALQQVRDGFGTEYLGFAASRGSLVVCDDPLQTRARLVTDWWRAADEDLSGSVMIALHRRDVAELNAAARALMDNTGRLGKDRLVARECEFAAGDRIVCRRNDQRLNVRNGTRGTIEHVDCDARSLQILTDRGHRVGLPAPYLDAGFLQHAYALTGHAGQGATVEHAFVLGVGEGKLLEWGYVALSRARETTRLYVTEPEREREAHAPLLEEDDTTTRFGRALEAPAAEMLALDHVEAQASPPGRPPRPPRNAELARVVATVGHERVRALSEDGAGDDLSQLPLVSLVQERDRLRAVARTMPRQRAASVPDSTDAGTQATARVSAAKRELASLGWRDRHRRGDELRREIAFQQSALELAERQVRERGRSSPPRECDTEIDRWLESHSGEVARLIAVERELTRRNRSAKLELSAEQETPRRPRERPPIELEF